MTRMWRLVPSGWAADAVAIGKTIHPHITLGERTAQAAEVAHGSCPDAPPAQEKISIKNGLLRFHRN